MKQKQEKKINTTGTFTAKNISLTLIMAILPAIVFFLYHFMKNSVNTEFIAGEIRLILFSAVFLFVIFVALHKNSLLYGNGNHLERFAAVYVIGILLVLIQCFLPEMLWLFLPLSVMLVLFSGLQTGVCSYILLLYLQVSLSQADTSVFLTYVCIGMIGILLFSYLDNEFLFGVPLFCALVFLFVALLTMEYAVYGQLQFDSFLYASINLFVSFLIITIVLKYLSYHILHKNRDKYQEINDPEYLLLTELKKSSPRAYYHAVHTAYFSEKIARKIGADEMLAKAGGYYHKIGKMRGSNNLKNALEIAKEYDFPPQLEQLLKEYGSKNVILRSKEAAIVLLADAMVSSVMFLFEKNKNAELDYEQIVDVVFKKQLECGILDCCELTMEQLTEIRKMFMEETLYYDFLR